MRLRIALIFSIFFFQNTSTQTINTSLKTTVRDISSLDIGFNRRSDKGNWWSDTSFKNLVAEMNPDIVRYPGGTQANYWDWKTGKFLENTDKNWNNKEVLKIPKFINNLPTATKIVYVVNMARPTPATGISVNTTEQVLKSDATLNLKIDNILEAIQEFKDNGKLPYAIELGNEFYFGNEESAIYHIVEENGKFHGGWDVVNNKPYEANNKKEATVFTAKFYLKHCKTTVAKIKAKYPNMKFALTTTKSGNGTSAREKWNNTIFDELNSNSEYATLKNDIYAVTQHHYLNDNYGVQTKINDITSSKVAIAEGIKYPTDKQADYNMVPNNYKIWYTEYGEVKEIAEETWASAVRYAAFAYSWLSLGDKVGQLDWHFISDNNVVKTGSPMKLAPVGIAAKLVSQAFSTMTEMQEIQFTNNTISVNGVKSLYGYKLKNDKKETLLIINTNNTDFSTLNFSNLFTYTGQPKKTQFYSDTPYVSNVYDGHSNIVSSFGDVNNSLEIKNFSLTVIESENTALSTDNYATNKALIYPNPASNTVYIKTETTLKLITIYDISGKKVAEFRKPLDSKINIENLNSGMYFIKIDTEKNSVFRKLIKK